MSETLVVIQPDALFDRLGLLSGMHVADLGCGRSGHLVFAAARRVGSTGMVYAVDVVPEVLEHLSGRIRAHGHDNVQVIWSDIEVVGKTAVPESSLDSCFLHNVMSSVNAQQRVFEEAARLVKPGGRIAVVDWARPLGSVTSIPYRLMPPNTIAVHAERAGLETGEPFSLGGYHYGMILSRPLDR